MAHLGHAMIADEDEKTALAIELILLLQIAERPLDDGVHLDLFRSHQPALGSAEMADVVEAEVVEDEDVERGWGGRLEQMVEVAGDVGVDGLRVLAGSM